VATPEPETTTKLPKPMRNTFILSSLLCTLATCTTNSSQRAATDSTNHVPAATTATPPTTDSLTLDLIALQKAGAFSKTQPIRVGDDPVFHRAKTYDGVPLKALLETYTTLRTLDVAQTQLVFECEDGYNPSMPLQMVLSRDAWLAVRDHDAPSGQNWTAATKNGETKVVAPFYMVYTNVPAKQHDYKWPYNLVRMSLVATSKELGAIYPHDDDTVVKGFGLFQKNCGTCHALNKVGGKMGPELNYPKSIVEYWRSTDDIKAFVKNPASYRHDCKMPAITYLADKELDEIIRYLQYMKGK
jgi:mono/diheme cytochrome c family protein